MNSKHKRTIKLIFKQPMQKDIQWNAIESLFNHLGADVSEGSGSRVRVQLNNEWAVFHKLHPHKEIDAGRLNSIRKFLRSAGVFYDTEV